VEDDTGNPEEMYVLLTRIAKVKTGSVPAVLSIVYE
jgi:hypothetical protein